VTRALTELRAAFGAFLLLAPRQWLEPLSGRPLDRVGLGVCRLLGARQLLQAALAGRRPTRRAELEGAAVDAAHAASMLALGALRPPRRTFARRNAVAGSVLALAGATAALATPSTRTDPVRRPKWART
jgi:hypothetical protein